MRLGKSVEIVKCKNRSGMRRLPPKNSLGLNKRNKWRNRRVLREGEAEWQVAATSMHDDVLLGSEECYE